MNVSALLIFVSSISIMLHPTQAEGEFENVLTFSLIALKSRFILSYFVYPKIHLPGLGSQTLPHNQVELLLVLLFNLFFPFISFLRVLLFSYLHENRHFKIPIWPRIRVSLGSSVYTPNTFSSNPQKSRKICHDKIFTDKIDTIFHLSLTKTEKNTFLW